jgi:DNA-binding winged helix-turn-helix (wHTH) protein
MGHARLWILVTRWVRSQPAPFDSPNFEVDVDACALSRAGAPIRLQQQPFDLPMALLERPGRLVSREELRQRMWPSDTFVDFDHSLNIAVNKLRAALSDSADKPRFIETVPRRGYRFNGTIEPTAAPKQDGAPSNRTPPVSLDRRLGGRPGRGRRSLVGNMD